MIIVFLRSFFSFGSIISLVYTDSVLCQLGKFLNICHKKNRPIARAIGVQRIQLESIVCKTVEVIYFLNATPFFAFAVPTDEQRGCQS